MANGEIFAIHIIDKGTNLLHIYKIPSNQYEKKQKSNTKMGWLAQKERQMALRYSTSQEN